MRFFLIALLCLPLVCSLCSCKTQQNLLESTVSLDNTVSSENQVTDFSEQVSSATQPTYTQIGFQNFCKQNPSFASDWEIYSFLECTSDYSTQTEEHACKASRIGSLLKILPNGVLLDQTRYVEKETECVKEYSYSKEQLVSIVGSDSTPFLSNYSEDCYQFFMCELYNISLSQGCLFSLCMLDSTTLLLGIEEDWYLAASPKKNLSLPYDEWLTNYHELSGEWKLGELVTSAKFVAEDYDKWAELAPGNILSVSDRGILIWEQNYQPILEKEVVSSYFSKTELCTYLGYLDGDKLPFFQDDVKVDCFEMVLQRPEDAKNKIFYICPIDENAFMLGVGGAFFVAERMSLY